MIKVYDHAGRLDISDEEAERIGAAVKSEDEFYVVWENEDWWTDENNPTDQGDE
jgi:hypothetical protein